MGVELATDYSPPFHYVGLVVPVLSGPVCVDLGVHAGPARNRSRHVRQLGCSLEASGSGGRRGGGEQVAARARGERGSEPQGCKEEQKGRPMRRVGRGAGPWAPWDS